MSENAVVWFRRDLRVGDQPTFLAAADVASRSLALFVLDPALLDPAGAARRTFLYRSLRDLDGALGGSVVNWIVKLGVLWYNVREE
jgi:deoxyribodipyrimidine photo-lyase